MTEQKRVFDAVGAFNSYYNAKTMNNPALSLPLEIGKAVPSTGLVQAVEQRTLPPKPQGSYVERVFGTIQKGIDLAHQTIAFGALLPEKNNPIWKGDINFDRVKRSWEAASEVSAGQALMRSTVGRAYDQFEDVFSGVVKTVSGGRLSGIDKFLQDHMLFAANDFDIYNKIQREEAFKGQIAGRFASGATDFIGAFVLDPLFVAGKAYKVTKGAMYAFKNIDKLNAALAGVDTSAKAIRIKNSFTGLIDNTRDFDFKDFFRIRAVRESANPAKMASVLAEVNKIEDVALRDETMGLVWRAGLGDVESMDKLVTSNPRFTAKLAALQDEVPNAKYLGQARDSRGRITYELLSEGDQFDNTAEIIQDFKDEIDAIYDLYQSDEILASLELGKVPQIDTAALLRIGAARSQNMIELRSKTGLAGGVVRVFTGLMYKTPRGWIDFTDNQSIQTVDNMLNLVRNITTKNSEVYRSNIELAQSVIKNPNSDDAARKRAQEIIAKNTKDLEDATFTVERKAQLLESYAAAADPIERGRVFEQIQQEVFTTIARQFRMTDAQAREAYSVFAAGYTRTRNLLKERAYTGAKEVLPDGRVGALGTRLNPVIDDADGIPTVILTPRAIRETQLQTKAQTIDVTAMYNTLRRATKANVIEEVSPIAGKAYRVWTAGKISVDEVLTWLDNNFKFQSLARLGYPTRGVGEGNLRVIATVGPMTLLSRYLNGTQRAVEKSWNRLPFTKRLESQPFEEIYDDYAKTILEHEADALEDVVDFIDNQEPVRARIKEIRDALTGKVPVRNVYGAGEIVINGYTLDDALGATVDQQEAIRRNFIRNASQVTEDMYSEMQRVGNQIMEMSGDWVEVAGSDPNWAEAYLRVVNRQLRSSGMAKYLLDPDLSQAQRIEELTKFLRTDGRKIMKDLGVPVERARDLAEVNVFDADNIFSNAEDLRRTAAQRQLTADDLKNHSMYSQYASSRPTINGAQIGQNTGELGVSRAYRRILNGFYEYVGEAPERVLNNHPLFVELYRRRLKSMVDNVVETYPGERVPGTMLKKLESQARQWARAEMRRTLYDVSETVDSAKVLRYFIPFFRSYGDSVQKWSRIVMNDPSVVPALMTVYNAPDRFGMTEERDGVTYINVPGEWVSKLKIFGDRPLSIPKTSLNLIFSGGSWWNPGAGWFVQIPLSEIVRRNPKLEQNVIVKEILPYGPDGNGWKDVFIQSTTLQRIARLIDENDRVRNNLTTLILAEENFKYENDLRETRPTIEEINSKVVKIISLEATAKALLPFSTGTRSPYQFYIDEFHRLREEDPANAAERFYDKYGEEFFAFTTSLSKNNTGIQATVTAAERAEQLSDLIAENPEYGWFFVGDANSGEFSPAVYQQQFKKSVAPGSSTKFRGTQDPYEGYKETLVEKGWIAYNKGMDLIEAQRIQYGYRSLNSADARWLKGIKDQFVLELENENPEWRKVHREINPEKVPNFLRLAKEATFDSRLKGRPDIESMREYLEGRELIRQRLAGRESQNIEDPRNVDLYDAWQAFIGELIDKDVTFNRIYTRILENDKLEGI